MSDSDAGYVAHHNVAVISAQDKKTLDAIYKAAGTRALIWKRLDDTHAIVDPTRVSTLVRRLEDGGFSPDFSFDIL